MLLPVALGNVLNLLNSSFAQTYLWVVRVFFHPPLKKMNRFLCIHVPLLFCQYLRALRVLCHPPKMVVTNSCILLRTFRFTYFRRDLRTFQLALGLVDRVEGGNIVVSRTLTRSS